MSNDTSPNLPPLKLFYRASGSLLHVASLPSPYGIGDVGPAANRNGGDCAMSPGPIVFPRRCLRQKARC